MILDSGQPPPSGPANSPEEQKVLTYVQSATREADSFIQQQKGYGIIDEAIKMVMGEYQTLQIPSTLSRTHVNEFSKIFFDATSALSDTKPFWSFKTLNKKYEDKARIISQLSENWWLREQGDMRFLDVMKYSSIAATGYSHLYWDRVRKEIVSEALDPRDVLPFRPRDKFSIQNAQGVAIRQEKTVEWVKERYPDKARWVRADRSGAMASGMAERLSFLSPLQANQLQRKTKNTIGGPVPVCDVYTFYFRDPRLNKSGGAVGIGEFDGTHASNDWSYVVEKGDPLYPDGRVCVFTSSVLLYDGPNPYWHGQFPVSKLTLDPVPWSYLGKSCMADIMGLQIALNKIERAIEDHIEQWARPDLMYEQNSFSRSKMQRVDTRESGKKIETRPSSGGKGAQLVYPPNMPPEIPAQRDWLKQEMKVLMGVEDMTNLSKLGQIPSSETVEKMAEAMTPIVRARSRVIEAYFREFATQMAYNFAQFYDAERRVSILGPNGLTTEDFDIDMNSFIPAWVDKEDYDEKGQLNEDAIRKPAKGRRARAKTFMTNFVFEVEPGSMLSAASISKKLLMLQLSRAGMIDMWTLGEVLGIPNMGDPPDINARTITQRLILQQNLGLGMSVSPAGRKASGEQMPSQQPNGVISESG